MPPGYAAFFLWVASAVLWWSGWREETAEGIPDRAVAVFLAGWPFAALKTIPLWEGAEAGGAFVWTTLAMAVLAWRMESGTRWTAVSAGILIGSFDMAAGYAQEIWVTAPEWLTGPAGWVASGLAAALLVKGAQGQTVAASAGLLLAELLSAAAWRHPVTATVRLGSAAWMEGWWISVLAARLFSVAASILGSRLRRAFWEKGEDRT